MVNGLGAWLVLDQKSGATATAIVSARSRRPQRFARFSRDRCPARPRLVDARRPGQKERPHARAVPGDRDARRDQSGAARAHAGHFAPALPPVRSRLELAVSVGTPGRLAHLAGAGLSPGSRGARLLVLTGGPSPTRRSSGFRWSRPCGSRRPGAGDLGRPGASSWCSHPRRAHRQRRPRRQAPGAELARRLLVFPPFIAFVLALLLRPVTLPAVVTVVLGSSPSGGAAGALRRRLAAALDPRDGPARLPAAGRLCFSASAWRRRDSYLLVQRAFGWTGTWVAT